MASGMVAISGLESVASLHAKDVNLATSTWVSVGAVQNGLGGGIEFVGGVWLLLVSVASLRSAAVSKALGGYGVLVGVVGVLTVVPPLKDLAAVFGLGQILWFAWIGGSMRRRRGDGQLGVSTTAHAPRS